MPQLDFFCYFHEYLFLLIFFSGLMLLCIRTVLPLFFLLFFSRAKWLADLSQLSLFFIKFQENFIEYFFFFSYFENFEKVVYLFLNYFYRFLGFFDQICNCLQLFGSFLFNKYNSNICYFFFPKLEQNFLFSFNSESVAQELTFLDNENENSSDELDELNILSERDEVLLDHIINDGETTDESESDLEFSDDEDDSSKDYCQEHYGRGSTEARKVVNDKVKKEVNSFFL